MNRMRPGWTIFAALLIALWLAPLQRAQAQTVSCSQASMTNVSFGPVDLFNGTGLTTTANLTYKCAASGNSGKTVAVCFSIGDPYGSFLNHQMMSGSNGLSFQMFKDAARTVPWGTVWGGTSMTPVTFTISGNNTISGTISLYASIPTSQTAPPPGLYTANYSGNNTAINYQVGAACTSSSPYTATISAFPFSVSATVIKSCKASAGPTSDINLGSVPAYATNVSANNAISITCTSTTPYYIGLLPSNGNTGGAGVMSGTGGNTAKVPYQLYSNGGLTTVWGNTATATSAGNGVAGTGNGSPQSITVYAKTPTADFQPDTYTDTVVVNVNY